MHAGFPLRKDDTILSDHGGLPINTPPKLVVVSMNADMDVLKDCPESSETRRQFLGALLKVLHPQGTVAFAIPRPWFVYGHRIRGAESSCSSALCTQMLRACILVILSPAFGNAISLVCSDSHACASHRVSCFTPRLVRHLSEQLLSPHHTLRAATHVD